MPRFERDRGGHRRHTQPPFQAVRECERTLPCVAGQPRDSRGLPPWWLGKMEGLSAASRATRVAAD